MKTPNGFHGCIRFIGAVVVAAVLSRCEAGNGNVLSFEKDGDGMLASSCKITTTTFTIEFWVKLRENAGTVERYFVTQNWGGKGRFQLGINTGRRLKAFMGDCCGWQDSGYDLPVGEWVHVALVQNEAGDWVWYVNGAEKTRLALMNTFAPDQGQNLTLGRHGLVTGGFAAPVDLSNVRVWSVARTEEEIAGNMNRYSVSPEDNLVASWPLNDIDGQAWEVVSGTKRAPTGEASFVAAADHPMDEHPSLCASGDALGFVYIPDGAAYVPTDVSIATTDFTLESWVYFTGKPEAWASTAEEFVFFRQYEGSTPGRMSVGIRNGKFAAFMGGYEGWLSSDYEVPLNEWVHLAFVHDGSHKVWRFFANGELVHQTSNGQAGVPPAAYRLLLGTEARTLTFPGYMAEARAWSVARSPAQIATYWNRRWGAARPKELLGYWPLDEGDGSATVENRVTGAVHTPVNGQWRCDDPWIFEADERAYASGAKSSKTGRIVTDVRLPGPSFTVETWVNYQSEEIDAYEVNICSQYSRSGSEAGRFQLGIRNGTFQAFLGNAGGWQDSGYVVPKGFWTHLAFVRDTANAEWRFYVNGELVKTVTGRTETDYGQAADSSVKFTVGGRQFSDQGFNGVLSDVRLWSVCRSASEIKENFKVFFRQAEPGLCGYWRLDEADVSLDPVLNKVTGERSSVVGGSSESFVAFLGRKKTGMILIVK